MTRASFPEIPVEALKSHAQPARVERVWRRLELDLVSAPRTRSFVYVWASAAALGIFAAGIAVGSRLRAPVDVTAVAEPRAALPLPGAGPTVEPEARVAHRPTAPARKRAHAPRGVPTGDTATEHYLPESYGDPVSVSESAPVAVVEFAEWEKLAEAGDFRAAKDALDREGGFERAAQRSSAAQLMVLADIARASGSREHAAQALKRVLSAYSSAPEAPVAAWTLGNLLEQAGDRAGAADAYATYRRLSPTGDFAEDAAARQVDAALSQGNLELGRRTLEEYAQNFPKGRRLAELRKRLTALEAPTDTSSAAPSEPDDDDDTTEPAATEPAAPPAAAREH